MQQEVQRPPLCTPGICPKSAVHNRFTHALPATVRILCVYQRLSPSTLRLALGIKPLYWVHRSILIVVASLLLDCAAAPCACCCSDCYSCLQVHVHGSDDDSSSWIGVAVQHLAVAREEPLMLAGCSNGRLQLYDLRQSQRAAASVQPHKSPMVRHIIIRCDTSCNATKQAPVPSFSIHLHGRS